MVNFEIKIKESKRLRKFVEPLYFWFTAFGFNPLKFFRSIRALPQVIKEYFIIKKQNKFSSNSFKIKFKAPCLSDRFDYSGIANGHYFHQDLYVAQRIFAKNPTKHVDIGSRIDGFVAHVASFRKIETFDIRPLKGSITNIIFTQLDLMSPNEKFYNYCDSLSCLHTIEHFGLGRYSDSIDIDGYKKGFQNLFTILKNNGTLYLSVPIGPERIDFNAHRCFSISTVLKLAEDKLRLTNFSYIDDYGDLHKDITLNDSLINDNCDCYYGCGIFEFLKI